MTKKTKYLLGIAGSVLAAGTLYAVPTYSETFNGSTDLPLGWTGGTVTASNVTYSSTAGLPISGSLASDNNVLVIEGDTTYTRSVLGTGGAPLLDMMVQTAHPDEELSTDETSSAQIAVAVDSNGCFNVYCKGKSGTPGWYKLSDKQYDESEWARVSLLFDYTNTPKRCQVRIDGEPIMSAAGYLTASTSDGTVNGAWYNLANDGNGVTNLTVLGCTAIDEVVMNVDDSTYQIAAGAAINGVSCAWLDANGLSWDTTQSYDSSTKTNGAPMTVADKYKYCFDPFDGQNEADFAVKSMATTASSVTVGVPATVATAGRKVVLESATNEGFTEGKQETAVSPATTTVEVNRIPAPGGVLYFRLRATDDNGNN